MLLISSSEAKNAIEFSFYYIYNFKRDRFFALYDIVHVRLYLISMMTLHNVSCHQN